MSPARGMILGFGAPILVLLAIQLVPYGRNHTNPPSRQLAAWDSPHTHELARRACFDCHSNETRWPWYSSIAPLSWRIQTHVLRGREKLNFTALDSGNEKMVEEAGEAAETVTQGTMPPQDYMLMHSSARLTAAEKRALAAGLEATLAPFAGRRKEGEGVRSESGDHGSRGRSHP